MTPDELEIALKQISPLYLVELYDAKDYIYVDKSMNKKHPNIQTRMATIDTRDKNVTHISFLTPAYLDDKALKLIIDFAKQRPAVIYNQKTNHSVKAKTNQISQIKKIIKATGNKDLSKIIDQL